MTTGPPARAALRGPSTVVRVDVERWPEMDLSGDEPQLFLVVSVHGVPVATVTTDRPDAPAPEGSPSAVRDRLSAVIWATAGREILGHLAADREGGFSTPVPACLPDAARDAGGLSCLSARPLPATPPVTVVIPTRDRIAYLTRCLRGLRAQDYPDFRVLVCDNGTVAGAVEEALRGLGDDRFDFVVEGRRGASHARNRVLREDLGAMVAFLDDDAVTDSGWLSALVRPMLFDPEVALVSCLVLPLRLDTWAQVWFEQFGSFDRGYRCERWDARSRGNAGGLFPLIASPVGTGAGFAVRTSVLRELGGFDVALGAGTPAKGGEDLDFFHRVLRAGHAVSYEPAAVVWHDHRRDLASLDRQVYDYGLGLTAYAFKWLLTEPWYTLSYAPRIPIAMWRFFGRTSPKNQGKGPKFPPRLTRLERRGALSGPPAYLRARRQSRSGP
jgi:GT2 family glycosyltransferase